MSPKLKNSVRIWKFARDLGIKLTDDPVSGILRFCDQRIRKVLRDFPDCKTLSDLLDCVASMDSKEMKRWLRALEIAKILFADQGYHTVYLEEIENLIRREAMYSPKINQELIPALFKIARLRKISMTKLVNQIIKNYLSNDKMMEVGVTNYKPKIRERLTTLKSNEFSRGG